MNLIFEQLNEKGCKTYLLASSKTGEAWLIDPVLDNLDCYLRLLDSRKLKLAFTIDTHTHADHISGSPKLRDLTSCAYMMHEAAQPKEVTDRLGEGAELTLDGEPIRILHTPGHTRDSLCLLLWDRVITGDTLFLDDGGAGRDDLPGGDAGQHWESLQKLSELHDKVVVYPGHDYRGRVPSTIGEQKQRNPFFKPRTQKDYVRFVEELKLGPADWMKEVLKANVACTRERGSLHIPEEGSACEALGTLAPCAGGADPATISAVQLKELMDSGAELVLLDVREPAELVGELGHLPGIKHVPVGSVSSRIEELKPFATKRVISICKMGGRARTAARVLLSEGFKDVTILTGGMNAWNESGLPVERTKPAPTH